MDEEVTTNENPNLPLLGIFKLPRENQRQLKRYGFLSKHKQEYPDSEILKVLPTRDEHSMNTFLINLCQAVCLKIEGFRCR